MRAFRGLVKKELIQVFRDRTMVRLIFLAPIIQLLIFGYVANLEVKNIRLDIYDYDRSARSQDLVTAMRAGEYFVPVHTPGFLFDPEDRFRRGQADMSLILRRDFSERVIQSRETVIGLVADGSNSNEAAIGMGYAAQIVWQYARDATDVVVPIDMRHQVLYNPEAESKYFMIPGLVAALLTMITVMLTSMAIVREREIGTLEQLMVTPISRTVLLLGKLFPFAVLGLVELSIALAFGIVWFEIPFVGSPLLIFGLSGVYLLTTLGMGLFFSTVTSTQQQAMFFAWFFFVFAMLTSGLFTPIANMPEWMQYLTYINPMRFFMNITRGIIMKGAGIGDLIEDIYILLIYGAAIFIFSAMRFTKRLV